jgi:hypothetical protein
MGRAVKLGPRGPEVERAGGIGLGFALLFFFKLISNQFQTFFLNSNFNTNFSNYFKGFSQHIFSNFSNIF